jgi:hypothetical protein
MYVGPTDFCRPRVLATSIHLISGGTRILFRGGIGVPGGGSNGGASGVQADVAAEIFEKREPNVATLSHPGRPEKSNRAPFGNLVVQNSKIHSGGEELIQYSFDSCLP